MKKTAAPLLVNTSELQQLLGGVCYRTAVKIGEAAGAKLMVGSKARWYIKKIEDYIANELNQPGGEHGV